MPRNNEDRLNVEDVDVETADVAADGDAKAWPPALEQKSAGFESGDDVEVKDASADIAVNVKETSDPFRFKLVGSVTGVVDRVNDVIQPGAYTKTLKVRTPKIIKDHEWSQRLGKVLSIKELRPGDPELPKTVADGSPWPKEAGALVADVQLFKKSQAGQEAAERWREYGRDQQFSIGYRVPAGASVKSKDGVRHIKELDLYEISDVLWGAAPDSTLLPSMLATKVLAGVELESKGGEPDDDEETVTDEVAAVEADEGVEDDNTQPPVTPEPFDDDESDFEIEEVDFDSDDIDAEAFDAFGDEVASMVDSDVPRGDNPEDRAPSTEDAAQHTADTVTDDAIPEQEAPDNAAAVDATVDGNVGALTDDPGTAAPSTGDEVENVAKKALGAISDHVGLRAALRIYEGSSDDEKALYGPYIAASAHAAGIDFLLPDNLSAIDVKELANDEAEIKYDISSTGKPGSKPNWISADGGSLPAFFRALVHALRRNGHTGGREYALAYGSIKRWAKGGGNVTPKTRAKAIAALAKMDALRAKAAAKRATKSIEPVDENMPDVVDAVDTDQAAAETLDAPVDVEEVTGSAERKSMMVPFFAGSQEEVRALTQVALNAAAEMGQFEGRPQIVGTFADYVIVTVWPDGPLLVGNDYSTYKVSFDYDADAGTLDLGRVEAIRITAKATGDKPDSNESDDMVDVLGGMDDDTSAGADSVKHAVAMLDLESKAGRVLSAANASDLSDVYATLGALLKKAGVDVGGSDDTEDDQDVVTDETDVDEKTLESAATDEPTTPEVTVPLEETEEYKILQLIRLESEMRARALQS